MKTFPFSLEQLQQGIRPLLLDAPIQPTANEQAYFSYYGIDFAQELSDVEHFFGWLESTPYAIACHIYKQPDAKGCFYLLHGYYDHIGLYKHVIKFLLQLGFNVFAFDLPGHGLSTGSRASIQMFSEYEGALSTCLQFAENKLPKPWHIIGQSTGGAVIIDYLQRNQFDVMTSPFQYIVLLAPLVRPRAWRQSLCAYFLLKPFIRQLKRRFTANSTDLSFVEFIRNEDPLQPINLSVDWVGALHHWIKEIEGSDKSSLSPVIIQGEQDTTVDWQHNLKVLDKIFTQPKKLILPSAKHHLVNESEAIRQRYFKFLREHLCPKPA
ncbi:alpha/beta hydrolase [Zooshikella harenae]|uniref:Alpha/beta hydrolase n=1 Tax=Zooshikella harenae TaxID=2827238 RepID=A0ABS5ZDM5_9GAMM|nr:alpha/beta hydrolase [Zooshikella harenae]MBU2711858.1 alpha/beta hydrolase [Zooshikella harenae]